MKIHPRIIKKLPQLLLQCRDREWYGDSQGNEAWAWEAAQRCLGQGFGVSLSTRKEQDHAIKIHPRIIKKIIKKLPQMASRGTLQAPSEPLGAPFGHTPYFKTLLDVIFRHFGSTLASLGAAFRRPLSLLSLSWTVQEPFKSSFFDPKSLQERSKRQKRNLQQPSRN